MTHSMSPLTRASAPRVALPVTGVVWLTLVLESCGGLTLYDVRRTRTEDCDITPAGEFCSEGGPSIDEVFAVDVRDDYTTVYFGDEAWLLQGNSGARTTEKRSSTTREPGPCVTSLRRVLVLEIDGPLLRGTLDESTLVEGPPACGETPRGTKRRYTLSGSITNAL